jgi:ketosteroid isomerase-like protein
MSDLTGKWMHGKDAIKADWTKALANPDFKLNWTVESADVSKDGSLGYTRGTFQGSDSGKPISGTYTTVWKKGKDGKWRVAVDIAGAASQQ